MSNPALSVRAVQRQLLALLPEARPAMAGESVLEFASSGMDAPRLISATVLEAGVLRAHRVMRAPTQAFRGFLDGTQRSEIVSHVGSVPIVLGRVAAVVRERRARRLVTWRRPMLETRVYAPRALLSAAAWEALEVASAGQLEDTSPATAGQAPHPFALRDAAIHMVQARRESLEQRLAERWCGEEQEPLCIDGGISGSERVAVSGCTVGVVKSHRTLYAEGEALDVVLGLARGERSSVFRITSPKRTTVASWYLRLRDPDGHDPMWGLVRVEIAEPRGDSTTRIADRADEVSSWILAEATPLSLPDARWDKMVYGIRDCEEFLRAVW